MDELYESPELLAFSGGEDADLVNRSCPYGGLYCNPPSAFFAQCTQVGAYNSICGGTSAHCTQLNTY